MSPMDRNLYPDNWTEIRALIQKRAGDKCERCLAPNGQWVWRLDKAAIVVSAERAAQLKASGEHVVRIVCTTAHVGNPNLDPPADKHNKMDCRPEALEFMCQACHLREDQADHVRHAAETRRRRTIDKGQMTLVEG